MGRKKKKQSKPWCWYCNREFDDEKILIQHQKAKHFKCHICHKKLYTGPGLSIHCMQVHKDTIDKVPNSLPNRGNIEIEIYGMEGIPDADVKEHERQKGAGGDDDDEPAFKRAKSDSPATMAPTPPAAGPGMMPGMMPGMPRPPFGAVPGFPYGVAGPGQSGPATYSGQPTGPNGQPVRPMFPSAAGSSGAKPTFPAYGDDKKPVLIATTSATTKIIHPPEDISLEEHRARMPRYALQNITPNNGNGAPSPATISAAATTAAAAAGAPGAGMVAASAGPVMSSVHGAPVVAGAPMFMQAGMHPRHAMMGHPGAPPPQFAAAMGMHPHPAAMGGFGRPPMTNPGYGGGGYGPPRLPPPPPPPRWGGPPRGGYHGGGYRPNY